MAKSCDKIVNQSQDARTDVSQSQTTDRSCDTTDQSDKSNVTDFEIMKAAENFKDQLKISDVKT